MAVSDEMHTLEFSGHDRVLFLAPHPDDEAIAQGLAIQSSLRSGAAVRLCVLTEGENNPWPIRYTKRSWRVSAEDRRRWGKRRRSEVQRSAALLGIPPKEVHFAGLPDQGLTDDAMRGSELLARYLREQLSSFAPTMVVAPSAMDLHPDHSMTSIVLREVAANHAGRGMRIFTYLVHAPRGGCAHPRWRAIGDAGDARRKLAATCCHETQMFLSAARFQAWSLRPERYFSLEDEDEIIGTVPRGCEIIRHGVEMLVRARAHQTPLALGRRHRILVRATGGGKSAISREVFSYRGASEFIFKAEALAATKLIALKNECQPIFFDCSGWRLLRLEESS